MLSKKIITLKNISKISRQYHKAQCLLAPCSVTIESGAFVAITGASGIGKSTLLNIIGCLDTASSGFYYLGNTEITALSVREAHAIRKQTFGYIFQQYLLIKHFYHSRKYDAPITVSPHSENPV